MKLSNKQKKILITTTTLILAVLLTAFWIMFAYIEVNSSPLNEYRTYKGTQIIAKNGDSKTHFKNTIEAFRTAVEDNNFDGIKTELRQTADGVWVCSDTDTPFADKSIKISKSFYKTLISLPLDVSGGSYNNENYYLASFDEYLNICSNQYKTAIIELQGNFKTENITDLSDYAVKTYSYEKVIFMSDDLKIIKSIKNASSFTKTLITCSSRLQAFCYAQMGYSVNFPKKKLSEKLIKRIHNKHNHVCVSNVANDQTTHNNYTSMYVDYIIVSTHT